MEKIVESSIGKLIIVELKSEECYSGELIKIGVDPYRLTLNNVTNLKDSKKLKGRLVYYKREIKNVRHLADQINSIEPIDEINDNNNVEQSNFSNEDLKKIQNNINHAIYIKQCDQIYHESVAELKRAEIIGVSLEDERFVRLKEASLLVMCTTEKIFIFDIKLLGVLNELKSILWSPLPRKVVHNSSLIGDYLFHRQKCQITNIFDTVIGHMQIVRKREVLGLQQCLNKYLNLPEGVLNSYKSIDWDRRPLSNEILYVAASKVAFLIKIYFFMVHDMLLKPLKLESEKFSKSLSSNEDDVAVFGQISMKQNPGVEDVTMENIDFLLNRIK